MLGWCHPGFAHLHWDNARIVRRVVRWVAAVRKGHPDRKTNNFPAEFVPSGSIGPAETESSAVVPAGRRTGARSKHGGFPLGKPPCARIGG